MRMFDDQVTGSYVMTDDDGKFLRLAAPSMNNGYIWYSHSASAWRAVDDGVRDVKLEAEYQELMKGTVK